MNQQNELIATSLQEQVTLGKNAETAYNNYIKGFIENQKRLIYEAFLQCSLEEQDKLIELKRLSMVYATLETAIQNDIATGNMAQIELESKLDK